MDGRIRKDVVSDGFLLNGGGVSTSEDLEIELSDSPEALLITVTRKETEPMARLRSS